MPVKVKSSLPPILTDNELIQKVKLDNDSVALLELASRHTGIYIKAIDGYVNSGINVNDLRDDALFNLYKFCQKFDSSRKMKFSTYIFQMTNYMCLGELKNKKPKLEIDSLEEGLYDAINYHESYEDGIDTDFDYLIKRLDSESLLIEIKSQIRDDLYAKVLQSRFFSSNDNNLKTWKEVGEECGVSHEWARSLYLQHLPFLTGLIKRDLDLDKVY